MKKKIFIPLFFIAILVILCSWGSLGHYKISLMAGGSYLKKMTSYSSWETFLAQHASDADERKSWDNTEGPKHYLDIEVYTEFTQTGKIIQSWNDIIAKYSKTYVEKNGTLPWATITAYDSLVNCLKRGNYSKASLFASDLGHYVADGHMPMHITTNYDGQLTGQSGIHSRYESSMISKYNSQISYTVSDPVLVQNVPQYIFDYIYASQKFVKTILDADLAAKSAAGGSTSSTTYYENLWLKTKETTLNLYKNGSQALANLIYTAWVNAGEPALNSPTAIESFSNNENIFNVYPNPAITETTVEFSLTIGSLVNISVYNSNGIFVKQLENEYKLPGFYNKTINVNDFKPGIYIMVIETGYQNLSKRLLIMSNN